MGEPEQTRRPVRVGVLLAQPPDELGEWLADATAFDAAGADALWIDAAGDGRFDPLALVAALSTITFRALLVAALPEPSGGPQAQARTLATIGRLSRGRLALRGERAQLAAPALAGSGPDGRGAAIFHRIDGNTFVCAGTGAEPERWVRTASPQSRAAWRAMVADAGERGAGGLLVPAGPRLLDILRNPDDLDDRRDLQLAQG